MKKHMEFLEWLSRFNPQAVDAFVVARRYELMTGIIGVDLSPEKIALLQEAVDAGLLTQNADVSSGAVKTGDADDQ